MISPSKRALYYATKAYSDQLTSGQGYGKLKATYSVSILMQSLWQDDQVHHHFRLTEKSTGMVFDDSIEIHTIELSKYNGKSDGLYSASILEQWCYWLKFSHEHTEEELRTLLPGLVFLHATQELKQIREVTEERQMYDSQEKAKLDLLSSVIDAREEGFEKGAVIGPILILQDLLEEHHGTKEELTQWSLDRLNTLLLSLQSKMRRRIS